jgi:phage baseplate assembly protein W
MVVNLITSRQKKITIYSDFKKDLEISPLSDDLTILKDEDAVKESIKNLILTNKGERLMQPLIGGNIQAMLFENMTPAVIKVMEESVRNTIELYEPRCELIDVIVSADYPNNTVRITVKYFITNQEQPVELTVFLERTR